MLHTHRECYNRIERVEVLGGLVLNRARYVAPSTIQSRWQRVVTIFTYL